jgi:hypothetical protein
MANTALETEFEELVKVAKARIDEKLDIAVKAIQEAVEISEETGVPFRSYVSLLGNSYSPDSFERLHGGKELDNDFVYDLTEAYYNCDGGWQHSMIC